MTTVQCMEAPVSHLKVLYVKEISCKLIVYRAQIILCFMLYIISTCMLYYSFNGDGLCTMAACSMKCKVENCTRLLANRCIPDAGLVYVPILYNHKLHYLYSMPYGRKFWQGIYFGGLVVLRAIRQNFTVCCHHNL